MTKMLAKYFFIIFVSNFSIIAAANADENTALKLVEHFNMGNNLEVMANQVAMQTVTVRGLQTKYEPTKVRFTVMDEIHSVVPKYKEKWNANLASAYSKYLTNEEILSIIQLEKKSPYISKMQSIQPSIGAEMQNASKPILGQLVGEAMLAVVAKLP